MTSLTASYIHKGFLMLFQRLGNLEEECEIKLKSDATPILLFTSSQLSRSCDWSEWHSSWPDKTLAIREMKPPTTISELQHFMGMVNQLGKFPPTLHSSHSHWENSLERTLLGSGDLVSCQGRAVQAYHSMIPRHQPKYPSSYCLGAVLTQKTESKWRPVAYASRSMTDTEQWYAQIEKEGLAITKGHMDQAIDKWQLHIYKLGFY